MIYKKELSFAVLALIAHSASVYASDNQLHEMCMKSKDYIGCMKSYSNNQKPIKNKCVEKFGKRECVLNAYIDSTCKSKGDMDQLVTNLSDQLKSMGLQWRAYSEYSLGADAEKFNADWYLAVKKKCPIALKESKKDVAISKKDSNKNQKAFKNDLQEICTEDGWCVAKRGKDMLGMPKVTGWFYKEFPEDNRVFYDNMKTFKVKVRGAYGRYIHRERVSRYYQNPKAGTSGYSVGGGVSNTNCYNYGSSISCNTTTSQPYTVPGRPAVPGGNIQVKIDYIIDCEDRTYETLIDNKGGKWKPLGDTILAENVEVYCSRDVLSYPESSITKYSKRKKR